MKFARRPFIVLVLATSLLTISAAQQAQSVDATAPQTQATSAGTPGQQKDPDPKTPGTPIPADSNKDAQSTSGQGKNAGTSNDRLFFTLPNFLTLENAGQVPPLTTGQKFKVVARSSFDYVEYPWYGALSGLSQAENSEPGYGQGAEGYGKRYAAAFADGTIENFMVGAVFPTLLRQDPRFFQSGQGGFAHRTGYAVSRIFITRTDSGHSQFNYSEIVGSALSAAISTNTYHPRGFQHDSLRPGHGHVDLYSRCIRSHFAEHSQRVGDAGGIRHHHNCGQGILARHPSQADPQAQG